MFSPHSKRYPEYGATHTEISILSSSASSHKGINFNQQELVITERVKGISNRSYLYGAENLCNQPRCWMKNVKKARKGDQIVEGLECSGEQPRENLSSEWPAGSTGILGRSAKDKTETAWKEREYIEKVLTRPPHQ